MTASTSRTPSNLVTYDPHDPIDRWLLGAVGDSAVDLGAFAALPDPVSSTVTYLNRLVAVVCEPGTELSWRLYSCAAARPGVTAGARTLLAGAFGASVPGATVDLPDCPASIRAAVAVCSSRPGWTLPALLACAGKGPQ